MKKTCKDCKYCKEIEKDTEGHVMACSSSNTSKGYYSSFYMGNCSNFETKTPKQSKKELKAKIELLELSVEGLKQGNDNKSKEIEKQSIKKSRAEKLIIKLKSDAKNTDSITTQIKETKVENQFLTACNKDHVKKEGEYKAKILDLEADKQIRNNIIYAKTTEVNDLCFKVSEAALLNETNTLTKENERLKRHLEEIDDYNTDLILERNKLRMITTNQAKTTENISDRISELEILLTLSREKVKTLKSKEKAVNSTWKEPLLVVEIRGVIDEIMLTESIKEVLPRIGNIKMTIQEL